MPRVGLVGVAIYRGPLGEKFAGREPCTVWLRGAEARDQNHYISIPV